MRPHQSVHAIGRPVPVPVQSWGPVAPGAGRGELRNGRRSPYLDDDRWDALVNRALPVDDSERNGRTPRGGPGAETSSEGEAFERFCRIALRTARWRFIAAMVATVVLTAVAVGVLVALLSSEGRSVLPGTGAATADQELRWAEHVGGAEPGYR